MIDSTGAADLCVWNIEPKDTTDLTSVFGLAKWTSPSSPVSQSFKLQYSTETSGTVGIDEMCIVAIESHADDEYIETDAETTTSSDGYTDAQTLTFTPSTTGDYLIIAYGELANLTLTNYTQVRLDVNGTASHTASALATSDISNYIPWMAVKKVNLTAVSQTIKIQYGLSSPSGVARIRRRRILAIRLDTLTANSSDYTSTRATTTSTTAVDAASTTFTAAGSVDYFAIGNVFLDHSAATSSSNAQLSMDGAAVARHFREHGNTTQESSYAAINYTTPSSGSRTHKTQVYAESGTTGYADRGVYVLDLREPSEAVGTVTQTLENTAVSADGSVADKILSLASTLDDVGGGPKPVIVDNAALSSTGVSQATHTFSTTSIGTAASDRLVVVSAYMRGANGSINSVTIGGITATYLSGEQGITDPYGMYYALVPSGTTADIVVNGSVNFNNCQIACWSLYNVQPSAGDADFSNTLGSVALQWVTTQAVALFSSGGTPTFTSYSAGLTQSFSLTEGSWYLRAAKYVQTTQPGNESLNITSSPSTGWQKVGAFWHPRNAVIEGTSPITGTVSQTLDGVTPTAAGTAPIVGSVSQTLDGVTHTADGTSPIIGSAAQTLADTTHTADGIVASTEAVGSLTATIGDTTHTADGTVTVVGSLAATIGDVTHTTDGTVTIVGSAAVTLDDTTRTADGTVTIVGSAAVTLDDTAGTITGTAASTGDAVLDATLEDVSASITGTSPIIGSSDVTLGDVTPTTAGTVAITAALSVSLDDTSAVAAGAVAVVGTASATLDTVAVVSNGSVAVLGASAPTLDDVTHVIDGTVSVPGTLDVTLDAATGSISGVVDVGGSLSAALGDSTVASSGVAAVSALVIVTLGDAVGSAAGTAAIIGSAARTLDGVLVESTITRQYVQAHADTVTVVDQADLAVRVDARIAASWSQPYTAAVNEGVHIDVSPTEIVAVVESS